MDFWGFFVLIMTQKCLETLKARKINKYNNNKVHIYTMQRNYPVCSSK